MIVNDIFLEELLLLQKEINKITNFNSLTETQLENFLKEFEKRRFKILNEIKKYNENIEDENNKIDYIDNDYKAYMQDEVLKIFIPESMPKYKNIKTHTYKRIMLNVAEKTKDYKDIFKDGAFIFIKVYDNQKNWDIDNKIVKPIPDGLILSEVISDDNINKMFYCVKGEYSEYPHTEVYIFHDKNVLDLLRKNGI